MHRDALVKAGPHALKRLVDEDDPAAIVVGGDAVLGDIDRLSDGPIRPEDRGCEGLRIELTAGVGELCTLRPGVQPRLS